MYRAVLLDVYGTLVRDDDAWAARAASLIAGRSAADPAVVARDWDERIWAMADAAHGAAFRTLADLTVSSLARTAALFGVPGAVPPPRPGGHPPLYADARPFLAARTVPVCLVSDADRDSLHALLDHHGITVEAVVTSEDARAYKPRPEPFRMALRRLGVTAAEVLHVGDSPAADIAGAAALGIATAFVRRAGRCLPASLTATHTVDALTELLPVLA
ncbi:hypothetical protein GCM10020358_51130 [Amorphoplanes nipponensis]|uniref:2-haloacid dehalogenase/putative hydrolase of the HAD superfamily n=1 Tax=Actinoplanes nipponensis TaxID=135950 RepID=A0A919JGI3_9ACTN|nr:HAD family hydrolase [Actinoplanes nipponensis]GIE48612.1 hypothetical protein Ani05nite_21460 [Actinoplanes nipponensis]